MSKVGRYTLLEPIAEGGMAEVFRARAEGSAGFAKEVAVKRVLPQLASDPGFIEQFLDEARVASRLRHPNIVQVYDFGEDEGAYYLAMEMLHGLDVGGALSRLHRAGEHMEWRLIAHVVAEACAGLHYAHLLKTDAGEPLGLVHRDVSPSNLFLTRFGGVKILDFGIAKTRDQLHQTMQGVIKGKYGYIAPEYVSGADPNPLFDVWAAGVTLHEMCTGRRLFRGANLAEAVRGVLSGPIPSPRAARDDIPEGLERVVMGCLERDPVRRYPSAGAVADELRELVGVFQGTTAVRDFVARWSDDEPGATDSKTATEANVGTSSSSSGGHLRAPAPVKLTPEEDELDTTHDTIDSDSAGITGTLEQMSVSQIVQLVGGTPRRCFVEVRSEGLAGGIGFDASGLVSARFGALAGLEAVFAMLQTSVGTFRIDYTGAPGARNLSPADAMRVERWLEAMRDGGAPPPLGVAPEDGPSVEERAPTLEIDSFDDGATEVQLRATDVGDAPDTLLLSYDPGDDEP